MAAAAVLVASAYAYHVNHVWEDYFITFRHSQNLCEGKGLLYNPGERLHGFTSPLGTLLPAVCHLVTGQRSYLPTLWLYRAFSILAFAGGGVLLLKAMRAANPEDRLSRAFAAVLYLLDAKAVEFTTDGQETGFMLLFLAWAAYLFTQDFSRHWLPGGLCWAGLLWTRPDGCVYIAALAQGIVLFGCAPWRRTLAALGKSAGVCAAVYLPWFAWAWAYYGTPVPHTMIAKSAVESGLAAHLQAVWGNVWDRFAESSAESFRPTYNQFDPAAWLPGYEWAQWPLVATAKYLGIFCAAYWLLPVRDRLGRMASLCFSVACLYLAAHHIVPPFPWYLPPATLFGLIVLTRGLVTLAHALAGVMPLDPIYRHAKGLAGVLLALFVLRQAALFGVSSWQLSVQQREVEIGHRVRIGEWLKEHVRPGESVYLEPFGYIGYFSGARVMDWPGLVAPEVVRVRRETGRTEGADKVTIVQPAAELRPDWMVLRPSEVEEMSQAEFFTEYVLMQRFDISEALQEYRLLPGPGWFQFDARLSVFKRMKSAKGERPFREVSLPVAPSELRQATWDNGVAIATGDEPVLIYVLPRPTQVAAIRLTFAYENAVAPAACAVSWAAQGPGGVGVVERASFWDQRTGAGEQTRLVRVDDTIERFRINPDHKPCRYRLLGLVLLVPREDAEPDG
jgi:hypothetical protein